MRRVLGTVSCAGLPRSLVRARAAAASAAGLGTPLPRMNSVAAGAAAAAAAAATAAAARIASRRVPLRHASSATTAGTTVQLSPLRFLSAVAYIPDPPKARTGGEDGSFVSQSGLALGVADGVGGWRDQGVDPGVYARLLMANAQAFCDAAESAGIAANAGAEGAAAAEAEELPLAAIVQAAKRTTVPGGSTCCVVLLRGRRIWAANLGDSGFLLLRNRAVLYRSGQQQHSFNFPFQLSSSAGADQPSAAQLHSCAVQAGDVIVTATDGLWDNLRDVETLSLVFDALAAGKGVTGAANAVCMAAHRVGMDPRAMSPFAVGAAAAGIRGVRGGKPDDCTVVVSQLVEVPEPAA